MRYTRMFTLLVAERVHNLQKCAREVDRYRLSDNWRYYFL